MTIYEQIKAPTSLASLAGSGHTDTSLTIEERRAFLNQPLEECRRLLSQQAEAIRFHYAQTH